MDPSVKKILSMLKDARVEKRCAAALVLAELRLKEAAVVDALLAVLTEDNQLLRGYALEALAGVKSPKVLLALSPLLDSGDEEVRRQVETILRQQGSQAGMAMLKELPRASLPRRRTLIQLLVRYHDKKIFEQLLRLLGDGELGEYVLNALRGEFDNMDQPAQETLKQLLSLALKDKKLQQDTDLLARSLRLLGYARDSKLVNVILPFAGAKRPHPVRLAALVGLRRPLSVAKSTDEIFRALLEFLDADDAALARAALDTMRGLSMPAGKEILAQLAKLAESRHHEVRKYALEMLGRSGDAKVAKNLLSHLGSQDPGGREAAARSLAHLEGAASTLVKDLRNSLEAHDRLETLCRLLRSHREELKQAERQSIAQLAAEALDEGHPAAELLSQLLVTIDAAAFASLLNARAQSLRKAKKFELALPLLRRLEDHRLLDEDGRYATLICGLNCLASKKELGRASRTTDPVLRQIVALLAAGDSVAAKMKREKTLSAEDLFYIGFNFVESREEVEKEFGAELLGHLAETAGRSKLGRSAKNKLKLVGWE